MSNILGALLVLAQAGSTSIPAVDVTAAEIRTTLETTAEIAPGIIDTPIRTLDTGAYDVSVAIVSRGPASNVVAGTTPTEVTEVYTVLEGSGTIVTGGRLIDPQPRGNANAAPSNPCCPYPLIVTSSCSAKSQRPVFSCHCLCCLACALFTSR